MVENLFCTCKDTAFLPNYPISLQTILSRHEPDFCHLRLVVARFFSF